jgi:hypothetical protein
MIEVAVAGLVAVSLVAAGAALLLPWQTLFYAGAILIAVGFGVGVPTGVVYHVQLYRCLEPRGALSKGWIWNPIDNHVHLRAGERRRVLPWCYTGAAGFVIIALGMLAIVCGMGATLVRPI